MASRDGFALATVASALISEEEIRENDVLLGRGKSNNKHPGNSRYHDIINDHRQLYFAATTNQDKKDITEQILLQIGGRFIRLRKDDTGGIEISKRDARIKIAQSLQYRQRQVQEKQTHIAGTPVATSTTNQPVSLKSRPPDARPAAAMVEGESIASMYNAALAVAAAESEPIDSSYDMEPISLPRTETAYDPTDIIGGLGTQSPMLFSPQQQGLVSTAAARFHQGFFSSGQPPPNTHSNEDMRWALAAYANSSMTQVSSSAAAVNELGGNEMYHFANSNVKEEDDGHEDDDDDDAIGIAFGDLKQKHPHRYQGF